MAGDRPVLVARERVADAVGVAERLGVGGGWEVPRSVAVAAYRRTISNESKSAGIVPSLSWMRAQQSGDLAQSLGLAQLGRLHPSALDELGDDRLRVVERGGHRRRHPEPGGPLVGDDLGAAVDPEQRGVLAGDADHVLAGVEPRPVVAVGDPARRGARASSTGRPSSGCEFLLTNRSEFVQKP